MDVGPKGPRKDCEQECEREKNASGDFGRSCPVSVLVRGFGARPAQGGAALCPAAALFCATPILRAPFPFGPAAGAATDGTAPG